VKKLIATETTSLKLIQEIHSTCGFFVHVIDVRWRVYVHT